MKDFIKEGVEWTCNDCEHGGGCVLTVADEGCPPVLCPWNEGQECNWEQSPVAVEYCECNWSYKQAYRFLKDEGGICQGHPCQCMRPINPVWQWQHGDPKPSKMPKGLEVWDHAHPKGWRHSALSSPSNWNNAKRRWNILKNPDVFEPLRDSEELPQQDDGRKVKEYCDGKCDHGQVMGFVGGRLADKTIDGLRYCGVCKKRWPHSDEQKVYSLKFEENGQPYFKTKCLGDEFCERSPSWSGHKFDGVAYTRLGFLFPGTPDKAIAFIEPHWAQVVEHAEHEFEIEVADRIVFQRVKEVDGE